MYAVIETGGKQYRVSEGDVITVEKLNVEDGANVELDKVLILGEGNDIQVGTPYIDGAKVMGRAVENGKAKKVVIFKYKSKKDYRKKQGHRQPYTMIEILSLDGKAPKKSDSKAEDKADATVEEEVKASASMKKEELLAIAEDKGIEIDSKATKADILEAIESASK